MSGRQRHHHSNYRMIGAVGTGVAYKSEGSRFRMLRSNIANSIEQAIMLSAQRHLPRVPF